MIDKRANKRKRVILTVEDKIKVCNLVRQNVPKASIIPQYNIGKSTLNNIIRDEKKFFT